MVQFDKKNLEGKFDKFNKDLQKFIDIEFLNAVDRRVPVLEGVLRKSSRVYSKIGEGILIHKTDYAQLRYFSNKKNPKTTFWWDKVIKNDLNKIENAVERFSKNYNFR